MAIWLLKFREWAVMALAAISAVVGVYLYGRQQGSHREAQKAAERDQQNARRVEDAADKARTVNGDPIKRLRKHGNIRD
jgi:predicted nucleic acid-binding protein